MGSWDLDLETGQSQRNLRHDQIFGYSAPLPRWGLDSMIDHVALHDRAAAVHGLGHGGHLDARVHHDDAHDDGEDRAGDDDAGEDEEESDDQSADAGRPAIHLPLADPYCAPEGYPIKANTHSGLYYTPDCDLYDDTVPDAQDPDIDAGIDAPPDAPAWTNTGFVSPTGTTRANVFRNGAWQDAYPDAGTTPFRAKRRSVSELKKSSLFSNATSRSSSLEGGPPVACA